MADELLQYAGSCFLNLKYQGRIIWVKHQDDPTPQSNAPDSDDLVCDVDHPVAIQQNSSFI
jgi:hypothetical protein